jgi:hypothetical protein
MPLEGSLYWSINQYLDFKFKEGICNRTAFKTKEPLKETLDKIVLKKTRGIATESTNKNKEYAANEIGNSF